MVTLTNTVAIVGANGLLRVCSYCVPRERLEQLHRDHLCTDGMCQSCSDTFHDELDAAEAARALRHVVLDVERRIENAARLRRIA